MLLTGTRRTSGLLADRCFEATWFHVSLEHRALGTKQLFGVGSTRYSSSAEDDYLHFQILETWQIDDSLSAFLGQCQVNHWLRWALKMSDTKVCLIDGGLPLSETTKGKGIWTNVYSLFVFLLQITTPYTDACGPLFQQKILSYVIEFALKKLH